VNLSYLRIAGRREKAGIQNLILYFPVYLEGRRLQDITDRGLKKEKNLSLRDGLVDNKVIRSN